MFTNPDTITGMNCEFPRAPYVAAHLPPEYHPAVREYFYKAAMRWRMRQPRRPGEEVPITPALAAEWAEEVAAEAYLEWLQTATDSIAAGDHPAALAGVRRYRDKRGWQTVKEGQRGRLKSAAQERAERWARWEARTQATPEQVVAAAELLMGAKHRRKATAVADQVGASSVYDLVREAYGYRR
jgi:hypothetical protein